MASQSRRASNRWLRSACADVKGDVLSIGSMGNQFSDLDMEGDCYRHYFSSADSYVTSDLSGDVDLILDVRSMPSLPDERFDGIFCAGVLEHVDDFMSGMREMTRILKKGGVLILGVPFRQPIHTFPGDYWRFTPYALEYMLKDYEILEMKAIGNRVKNFSITYYAKAIKK